MRNLDITTLRSFVAVAQSGGVTRAAGFLNLTQSAVSMQLKRLEEMLGLQLLDRSGRGVALTPAGAQLLAYAQKMVDLNDEIYSRLTDQAWEGEITLGVPHDIVYPVIPEVLKRMGRSHPRVKVQLLSSYTRDLKMLFAKGEVDVMLTTEDRLDEGGESLVSVPLRWIGAPDGQAHRARPLRLAYNQNCGFRPGAMAHLDAAGIEWEMAVITDNDRTVEASVSADLAVSSCLEGHAPPQLAYIEPGVLPDQGQQHINLYGGSGKQALVETMKTYLRQGFASV
ncbi:LysR family transcriptional regulator [Tropicibacter oceani]|uniref:LysR family transcriptional regulator n=1 Tax=Tropicibacter oceani TaxID=3058420 RepID=A0ABY8QCP7_9RHOB|nr:LysR family transcriptional regulator [Tropicibacter oceani]WGW02203.1 LysR family transcriptional regulator [Tropicibacter oceani]